MGSSFFMYMTFVWLVVFLLGAFFEMSFSTTSTEATALNALFAFDVFKFYELNLLVTEIKVPYPNAQFFEGIRMLLLWDYEFLKGDWNIVRWLFMTLTAGMMFGLVTKIMPLFLQIISTLRRLLPV